MIKTIFCLVAFMPLLVGRGLAQTNSSASGQSGIGEQKVAAAVESLRKALIDPDRATLDKLTMDELTYGHSNGLIQDKQAFIEALTSGKSDFVTVDLSQQTIRIVGHIALVRHILSATTNDGGKPGSTRLGVLLVWLEQKDGSWKLLARQATKVPLTSQ